MHLTVHAIRSTDTSARLKLLWPDPERDSELAVSVCGQSDACKTIPPSTVL